MMTKKTKAACLLVCWCIVTTPTLAGFRPHCKWGLIPISTERSSILIKYVLSFQKRISDAFTKRADFVRTNYTEEEQQIIGCPTAEQLSLLLNQ
jgi:hypothetical protein